MSDVATAAPARERAAVRWPRLAAAAYAGTSAVSAFLLFLVQPIAAKQILPWFGGSAAVWATCLVFFQAVLVAGYAYAHLTARLSPRRQAGLHVALLALSLATLPIAASAEWKPRGDEAPVPRILLLLLATVGAPYFLLSATAPLVQAWYWRRFRARAPYRLYALSNLASLAALLAFPLALEPALDLDRLARGWSLLFAAFAAGCALTAWLSAAEAGGAQGAPDGHSASAAPSLPRGAAWRWLGLAAMGSAMLVAVTNQLTRHVASVPWLWVLPLAVYLVTFALAFDHPRWYRRPAYAGALAVLLPAMAWHAFAPDVKLAAPLFLAGLFAACMVCHGELAAAAPHPRHLTRFYLLVALGGAAGAALVALAAPLVLPGFFELGLALVALHAYVATRLRGRAGRRTGAGARWAAAGVSGALLGLTLAGVVAGIHGYASRARVLARDFYGVVRTVDYAEPVPYRTLDHGGIMHGGQLLDPARRRQGTSYFGPTSGCQRVLAALRAREPGRPLAVGVVGLGAGVMAALMEPGDALTFYEISPRVVDVARREFTFLADTAARTEIVVGDGRLALEREPPRGYDLLLIDAFAGNAVPMHLLTREAVAIYLRHVRPDGAIVFQATNRHVDLPPVLGAVARSHGLRAALVTDVPPAAPGADYCCVASDQVIATRDPSLLADPRVAVAARPMPERPDLPVFTDARHSLFRILR